MRTIVGATKLIISIFVTFTYMALFMLAFAISYWSESILFFMVVMTTVIIIGYGIHHFIHWLLKEENDAIHK